VLTKEKRGHDDRKGVIAHLSQASEGNEAF
jgi:hypothetical protein